MKSSSLLAAALAVGALTSAASATPMQLFFSTTPGPTAATTLTPSNPSISLNIGETKTLYIWGHVTSTTSTNRLSGLALDIKQSASGRVSGSSLVLDDPFNETLELNRWEQNASGSTVFGGAGLSGAFIEQGANAVSVTSAGFVASSDPSHDLGATSTNGNWYIGSINLTGLTAGTSDLFMSVGANSITYKGTETNIFFGSGDNAITAATPGNVSTLADATITVVSAVPEPASLAVLSMAGVALLARKRRRP